MAGFCSKGLELFKEMAFCPPKTLPPYNVIFGAVFPCANNGRRDRLTSCQRLLCLPLDHCKSTQPGLGATTVPKINF